MRKVIICVGFLAWFLVMFPLASNDDLADTQAENYILEESPQEEVSKNLHIEEVDEKQMVDTMIIHACKDYGIDSTIPVAIARYETGHYTSKAFKQNNVGGMCINEKPMSFDSLENGVDAFVRNLADNYFRTGLDDVEKISKKYCPINAEKWAKTVNKIIKESANA